MPLSIDFLARLRAIQQAKRSTLCVGLDPDLQRLPIHLVRDNDPADALVQFCLRIVEATHHAACAFKVNLAFFEVLGSEGWRALEQLCASTPADTLMIADAKRGDIGNSARFYAQATLEHLNCDAVTVAPYMGQDAVRPFLQYEGKAAFVLGHTSNPGRLDFQELDCAGTPLYRRVARQVAAWGAEAPGTAGLVVGATDAVAMATLRADVPDTPFLIPGVGAQGGDATSVMEAAATAEGLVLVNSSRGIIYASEGRDFAAQAGEAAATLRQTLWEALPNGAFG